MVNSIRNISMILAFNLFSLVLSKPAYSESISQLCKQISDKKWRCRTTSPAKATFSQVCKWPIRTDGCSTDFKKKVSKKLFKRYNRLFYNACDYHDVCYNFKGKKVCDKAFYSAMLRICKTKAKPGRRAGCRRTALAYYGAVKLQKRHKTSYKNAQKNAEDKKCRPG